MAQEDVRVKDELIESMLKVLRKNPKFSKIEERNIKRIMRKLEQNDLVYLANVFDVYMEWLVRQLGSNA
ncbi:MAG: hypothetical protein QXY49_03915 [Thermofilaceae archaeon]